MDKKILISFLVIALTTGYLIFTGMRESASFYITPSEFFQNIEKYRNKNLKVGGFVSELQVEGLKHYFVITDGKYSIPVTFTGVPPDLFGKAKGTIVEGRWDEQNRIFSAKTIMAKHSEEYHPPEIPKNVEQYSK